MNFYVVVIAIAVIIFTAIMVWFAYTLNAVTSKEIFPPVTNLCPDGWTSSTTSAGVNKCSITGTTGNVGTGIPTQSPNENLYNKTTTTAGTVTTVYPDATSWNLNGMSTICGKRMWANQYNVQWGGVSNYNGC
jgi:hypothetical protein